jgi:hypothetical protein
VKQLLKKVLPAPVVRLVQRVLRPRYPGRLWAAPTYDQDGLLTIHNCDFMKEPRFQAAYALGKATGSWLGYDIHWRVHVACWCAERAKGLPGDFVECGVNKGGISRAVMHYVGFEALTKKFYLLDTFHGLEKRLVTDEEMARGVDHFPYEECYEQVEETFKGYPNVEIIRGAVPDTLPLVKAERVSYLSIDMNCVAPEIAAAEYFWDKLVPGAAMLLDDYGWATHLLQKQAFDRFAAARGVPVLALPTGQGLILKP